MPKTKSSTSSPPDKLIRVKASDIFNKPLTAEQEAVLEKLAKRPSSEIDYSDIPELADEQLARLRPAKELVAVRLDADIAAWLRRLGPGYTTRINSILRAVMEKNQAS